MGSIKRMHSEFPERARVILLLVGVTTATLHWYIQNSAMAELLSPHFPGDIGAYIIRFASAALLLGGIPLVCVFALGYSAKDVGLARPTKKIGVHVYGIGILVMACFGFIGSRTSSLVGFYPFSKTIIELGRINFWWMVLHISGYAVLYYLPWELFFRGILLFPFVSDRKSSDKFPPVGVFIQVIPSVMIHFGYPPSILFGAIPFGFLTGYVAWRTRSIYFLWVMHLTLGITQDIAILLR